MFVYNRLFILAAILRPCRATSECVAGSIGAVQRLDLFDAEGIVLVQSRTAVVRPLEHTHSLRSSSSASTPDSGNVRHSSLRVYPALSLLAKARSASNQDAWLAAKSAIAAAPTSSAALSFSGSRSENSSLTTVFPRAFPALAHTRCDDEEHAMLFNGSNPNGRYPSVAKLREVWYQADIQGLLVHDDDEHSCILKDDTTEGPWESMMQGTAKVMTIVSRPEKAICNTEQSKQGKDYKDSGSTASTLHSFRVTGDLIDRGGDRNYATVWPLSHRRGVQHPIVIALHGHAEHEDPSLLAAWGFLHYAHHDEYCRKKLGSLLVFPQLKNGESWVHDAKAAFSGFVLPLLADLEQRYPTVLDSNKVAILGYSEGAVGALFAAMYYPDVFSIAVAGSPTLKQEDWQRPDMVELARSVAPMFPQNERKLKVVVIGYGIQDFVGPVDLSLKNVLAMLKRGGTEAHSSIHLRIYKGLNHIDCYESLFNHWRDLHELLWVGTFESKTPWAWYNQLFIVTTMIALACTRLAGSTIEGEAVKGKDLVTSWQQKLMSIIRSLNPQVAKPYMPQPLQPVGKFEEPIRTVGQTAQEVTNDLAHLPYTGMLEFLPDTKDLAMLSTDSRNSLSFAQLRQIIRTQGMSLESLVGPASSARLALVVPQGPEALTALMTVFAAGVQIIAPMDPKFSRGEFLRLMQDPKLRLTAVVIAAGPAGEQAVAAAREANLTVVLLRAVPSDAGGFTLEAAHAGKAMSCPASAGFATRGPALVLATSGTTGQPKWVCQPASGVLLGARLIAGSLELLPEDRGVNVMPLHHIGGICCSLASLASGGSVVCAEAFEPEAFCSWLEGSQGKKPTWYYSAPTIHNAVADAALEMKPRHQLRLARSGAAAMPPALKEKLEEALGCAALPTYSMSECMPVCATLLSESRLDPASVGPPIGPSLRIAGPDGTSCPFGEMGEVMIRQQRLVTPGYLGDDGEPASMEGEWLRTGDLGKIDTQGRVTLTGRSKEVINRAGETIAPSDVEDALLRLPGIADAMAFAVPSEEFGDVVGAVIVTVDGNPKSVTLANIWRNLTDRVARQLWPELIVYMKAAPKGRTGKKLRVGFAGTLEGAAQPFVFPSAYVGEFGPVRAGSMAPSVRVVSQDTGFSKDAPASSNPKGSLRERLFGQQKQGLAKAEGAKSGIMTLESEVELIWREVLGLSGSVDWDMSLWALGGRSSQMAAVVARARAAFNLAPDRLPLTLAMSKPTLRGFVSTVQTASGKVQQGKPSRVAGRTASSEVLVPLGEHAATGDERPAVILVAGRAKSCLRFGPLAAAMPSMRFFGLERPGRGTRSGDQVSEEAAEDAPAIARQFASAVYDRFGSTPVVFAGPCFGSLWAFAVAVELEKLGGKPGRLVCFDGGCPSQDAEPFTKQAEFIREFLAGDPSEKDVSRFLQSLQSEHEKFDDEASMSLLKCWLWDNDAYVSLIRHLDVGSEAFAQVKCPIAVFRATEDVDAFMRFRNDRDWASFTASGPFAYKPMACSHFELMSNIMRDVQQSKTFKAELEGLFVAAPDDSAEGEAANQMVCPWQVFARLRKTALALIDEDENQVQHNQLMTEALVMAAWLRSNGVQPDTRVMLMGVPSRFVLTAQLALLHCGAAAVPCSGSDSAEYVQQVIEAAGITHLLCQQAPYGSSWWGISVLVHDATKLGAADEAVPAFVPRKGAATILFSSGTTGKPKGVVQSFGTLLELAADTVPQDMPRLWKGAIGWIANYALPPALVAQALLVVPADKAMDPFAFQGVRKRHGVDRLTLSPSELNAFCTAPGCLSDLRVITCMAEALPISLVKNVYSQYESLRLEESYASSEVQGSNAFLSTEVPRDATKTGRFRVRAGQAILVDSQDSTRLIEEQGETGELLLVPTAVGYLSEEQTMKRFIPNPFGPGKLFRTGDLCKWVEENVLELAGRVDFQVKVSGQLVALEQVEAAADELKGVQASAARTYVRASGTTAVALYLACSSPLDEDVVRRELTKKLPSHAVPAFIGFLDSIPLLPNGKRNRKALPEPDEGEQVTDSIGLVREVGARVAKEHRMAQALFGFSAVALPVLHWIPHSLPDEPQATQMAMELLAACASHMSVPLLVWIVGYMDGRAKRSPNELMSQCMIVMAIYVLMAWPTLVPFAAGFATFHRWSCLAFVLYRLSPLGFGFLRLPGWLQVTICWVLAAALGHEMIAVPWLRSETDAYTEPLLLLTEPRFFSTQGMFFKDMGSYLFAYHLGSSALSNRTQKLLSRPAWVGMLAGVVWIFGVLMQVIVDVPWDPEAPAEIADWPNYFDRFYPVRLVFDALLAALLILAIGEGTASMRLLGTGLVGTFLVHMYIRLDLVNFIASARPFGTPAQTLVAIAVPIAYVVTLGAGVQYLVVKAVRLKVS